MKRILFTILALILFVGVAYAASEEVYRAREGLAHVVATDTSASTKTSSAFDSQTQVIRVVVTTDSFIAIGASTADWPVATAATGLFIPDNEPEYFHITRGSWLAVLASGTNGAIYIQEMTR